VIMKRDPLAKRKGYTSRSYIQALEEGLLPFYDGWRHFIQDNASIHRSRVSMAWLRTKGISVTDWPAHSPDLNPIEHCWAWMKSYLRRNWPDQSNLLRNEADIAEFERRIRLAWEAIPQDVVDRLIDSMPRRLRAVKNARGWYTKY
jgi:transposase